MTAMGQTNDAILFGGRVDLQVACKDAEAAQLAQALPSCASKDYGKTFAEVFRFYEMDFYKIDPMLFSPAVVYVTNVETGKIFEAGHFNADLIQASFSS